MAGLVIRWPTLRTNISERPCRRDWLLAVGRGVHAVGVEAAGEGLAALGRRSSVSVPLQDAEPVAVGQHLVVGVHGGHRVFQVEDGGQRGFEHQVAHAGRVAGADGACAVDDACPGAGRCAQQHALRAPWRRPGSRRTALASARLVLLPSASLTASLPPLTRVADRVHMRALAQRGAAVEHMARVGNHLGAALGVVAALFADLFAALGLVDHVGAIQRVVQASPSARWRR